MTKADLVSQIKADVEKELGNDVSKKVVKAVIDSMLSQVSECMTRGDEILLQPLGRFSVKFRKARKATNMTTGEKIDIPEKFAPAFTAATALKEGVAQLPTEGAA